MNIYIAPIWKISLMLVPTANAVKTQRCCQTEIHQDLFKLERSAIFILAALFDHSYFDETLIAIQFISVA